VAKQRTKRTRGALPSPLFSTIVADCPWGYAQFGLRRHGSHKPHYKGSSVEFLSKIPVAEWGKKDVNLFHWITGPKIEDGIDVMRAWGFHSVTWVPWIKTIRHKGRIKRGVGFWGYSTAEILLICRRGHAKAPRYRSGADKPYMLLCGPREDPCFYDPELHEYLSDPAYTDLCAPAFYSKLGPHSRKPLSLFSWIESYLPGKYLELFARGTRTGWTCVGHESAPEQWHLCAEGPVLLSEAIKRGLVEIKDS